MAENVQNFAVAAQPRLSKTTAVVAAKPFVVSTNVRAPQKLILDLAVGLTFSEPPTQQRKAYLATDGNTYFVPLIRIGKRSRTSKVPDVRIDRQQDGYVMQIRFELLRPEGIPATAKQLPLSNYTFSLQGAAGAPALSWVLDFTPAEAEQVISNLRARTNVTESQLPIVLDILKKERNAWFLLQGTAEFRVAQPPQDATPVTVRDHRTSTTPVTVRDHRTSAAGTAISMTGAKPVAFKPAMINTAVLNQPGVAVQPHPAPPPPPLQQVAVALSSRDTTSAFFPTDIKTNRAIYLEVDGNVAGDTGSHWISVANLGDLKESPAPNQYYVLPDEFGLAFDTETGRPMLNLLLMPSSNASATGAASFLVRVRFGLVPLVDEKRAEKIRELLRQQEGLAFCDLAVGGYKKAIFDAFNILEQIGARREDVPADSARIEVDPKNGFEISLDLALEQYTLLSRQLLASTGSLRGKVRFEIDVDDETIQTRDIDVRIRLDRPASHPLIIRPESGNGDSPPDSVVIENPSLAKVSINRVIAALLQIDDQTPLEFYQGVADPTALILEPGAKAAVSVRPVQSERTSWNALAIALDDVSVDINATDVLSRAQELASSTQLRTKVRIWNFLFRDPSKMPPELSAKLFGVDVQLRKTADSPVVTVTLTVGDQEKFAEVFTTLTDLVQGMTPGQPTFEFRVRNKLFTGDGEWSVWQQFTGMELHVSPNPVT